MSRTRIVKGKLTKVTHEDHFIFSRGSIVNNGATKVIQKGDEKGVVYGTPDFPDLVYEPTEYKLKSPLAHEQLKNTAKELSEMTFILLMLQIFGEEIEVEAIGKLYKDLCDDKLEPPEIIVTKDPIKNYKANYTNKRKKILVSKGFVEEAVKDNEVKAQLMVALLEEYGHHIDNLLRTDYATNGKEDKDRIDEGAKFAYYFLTVDLAKTPQLEFAEAEIPEYKGKLILDLEKESQDLSQYANQDQWYDDDPNEDDIENFGFGFAHGTHGGIEMDALSKVGFQQSEILQIYYGNWLRDVSQVLVPFTIRFTKEVRAVVENHNEKTKGRTQHIQAGNTAKFSHDGWVEIIELFAAKEFVYTKGGDKIKTENYVKHLERFRATYGQLTKDILGIYRPEEHIDNPRGLEREPQAVYDETRVKREVPGGFEEISFYIGESEECFRVNSFGQKYYIYRDDEDAQRKMGEKTMIKADPLRPSSDSYMSNQLRLAVMKGKNRDGFRHFGAALHVLEDYFSHTNFVELSLCKLGWTKKGFEHLKKVYPWVQNRQGTDYSKIPVVTGKFLLDDTCASVVPKMADMLLPIGFSSYEVGNPGERTFGQQTIYTVLKDLAQGQKEDPTQKSVQYLGMDSVDLFEYYKKLLELSDWMTTQKQRKDAVGWVMRSLGFVSHYMGEILMNFTNVVFNILIESVDDDIKEAQTHGTNVNYGEDPTHTQIGKDAHENPLNGLAAILATIAVKDVGQRMKDIWEGRVSDPNGSNLVSYVQNTYSRHPRAVNWMDQEIENWVNRVSKDPAFLNKLYHPTPVAHAHDTAKRKVKIGLDKIEELKRHFLK
ncbi:hypothetical protein EGY05_07690 [Chryseobacterium arthrosphaerae]|uniref:Heterokaryon incompatibility protein Het-C n=1 Tax=Chryseobacterium arthrosphaerae TaxID=651561 RepID=A0A1B8ZPW8_9FLAO|nr:HET-C-related protein [Chryseobacterium arthrosphaerae]AYZ11811.1 hypothetical protein EGY05_07690 [Chryseobacterium arthrosphaerae]MDG4653117.1 hypothetical protein [Chryseobacterium arthrosphaerae]OCA73646.1 hypothetical protein BBI00_04490 [Chryseobacterium arthrosphaerae]RTZ46742.1 hypothetical protein EJ377_22655 [Chryseobacterium arthrosphaerae]